ncbi:hypothetical protein [Ornatilinea apprima]|uniref:hypothetical protein n=1 Tax=Ornatilinea apprima TaxID=1134406 RepID=UPI001364A259|nr:hypothetical protein [Ornatilinea apprima]
MFIAGSICANRFSGKLILVTLPQTWRVGQLWRFNDVGAGISEFGVVKKASHVMVAED